MTKLADITPKLESLGIQCPPLPWRAVVTWRQPLEIVIEAQNGQRVTSLVHTGAPVEMEQTARLMAMAPEMAELLHGFVLMTENMTEARTLGSNLWFIVQNATAMLEDVHHGALDVSKTAAEDPREALGLTERLYTLDIDGQRRVENDVMSILERLTRELFRRRQMHVDVDKVQTSEQRERVPVTGIAPCPFCAGVAFLEQMRQLGAADGDAWEYMVACSSCSSHGPWFTNHESAKRAWNQRAAPSSVHVLAEDTLRVLAPDKHEVIRQHYRGRSSATRTRGR